MYTSSTPAISDATRTASLHFPFFPGGVTTTILGTPHIFGGIEAINTVDGYAALPPGT